MRRSPSASAGIASRASDEVDQARLGGQVALVGGAVGFVDARIADQARERPAERGVGAGRRRPAQTG